MKNLIYSETFHKAHQYAKKYKIPQFSYIGNLGRLYGLRDIQVICLDKPSKEMMIDAKLRNITLNPVTDWWKNEFSTNYK